MSRYSNFVGYVPDKLRLVTSGGGLDSILGISTNVVAGTAIGYVGTGEYAANPGLSLIGATNFTVSTGCSYIDFSNLVASTADITITGANNGSGVPLEISFSNLTVAARTVIAGENIKKVSCPQLKTLCETLSLGGKNAEIASGLILNNGNTLTGEYYFPVLESMLSTDFAQANWAVGITYGSGGLANIDQTFPAWKKGNIYIVRNSAISGNTTATITPVVDFLPSFQAGNLRFDVPSNYTNVAIAMNYTGLTGRNADYIINTHDNTTGIQVPNFTTVNSRVFITGTTTTPNNLTVNFSGGLVSTGVSRSFQINYPATGLNQSLTVNNNQFLVGPNVANSGLASIASSGNLYFSGGPLEAIGLNSNITTNAAFSLTANNNLEFSTTGTQFISLTLTSVNSASGNITIQHPNVTSFAPNYQITGASGTSGKTLYLNAPEATGRPATGLITVFPDLYAAAIGFFALGTDSTGIINVPKLHAWDSISGTGACVVRGVSGTVITITGADITSASGSFVFTTSGSIVYNFTGGPGSGSGFITQGIVNRTAISGATISGNFGTLASGSTITGFASGDASTITIIATGLHQISGNVVLSGISGSTVNITGADLSYISGALTASTSGAINYTFTGGTERSGFITQNITNSTVASGATISGNLGTLTSGGSITGFASGNASTITTLITGLYQIGGNVTLSGISGSTINITGADLSYISGALTASTSGTINYTFTGGTERSGFIPLGITNRTFISGATISGNFGTLASGGSITGFASGNTSTITIIATGLHQVGGNVSLSGISGSTVNITGADLSYISGALTASTSGIINYTFTGGTERSGFISGQLTNTAFVSGATISGNFGTLTSVPGIINFAGGNPSTITTLITGVHQYNNLIRLSGVAGSTINFIGADPSYISGTIQVITSGTVNQTFTGGTQRSGVITSAISYTTLGAATGNISGNFGTLTTCSSSILLAATASTGTITFIATGLHQIANQGLFLSGASSNTINITGADLSYISGVLIASASGTVNFTFTGGTPRSGVITQGVFITGFTAGSVISGNLGTLATPSGIRIVSSGTTTLTATGITSVSGVYPNSLVISGLTVSSVVSGIFPGLQTISDDLAVTVSGSGGISFSGLQVVSGAYIVSGGSAAVRVDHGLSGLASLTGIGLIQSKTQTLYLGPVDAVTGAVSVTGLKQIGNSGTIFNLVSGVVTSSGITNFDMRSLTGWYGRINVQLPAATGFDLSSVQFIGSNSATGFAAAQMNTPALQFILGTGVTGDLTLTGLQYLYHRDMHNAVTQGTATGFLLIASGATSISMPNIITGFLRQISGSTTKTGWIQGASVTGLTFGSSGTTKELFMNFTASGCPLNQASVDNILQTFASLDGTNSTTVYSGLTIRLNGLCAAPSATGSGYRTTLTGAGRLNTVLVN